jgi:hypothetical protein
MGEHDFSTEDIGRIGGDAPSSSDSELTHLCGNFASSGTGLDDRLGGISDLSGQFCGSLAGVDIGGVELDGTADSPGGTGRDVAVGCGLIPWLHANDAGRLNVNPSPCSSKGVGGNIVVF